MGIAQYIKEIGRGREGARSLSREQACDLMGQILDSPEKSLVTDLEIGAFCLAMRIKGETPEEMAGFLDAIHGRIKRITSSANTSVAVIPSYNGARRLPVLTPLLAHLLAREGIAVLIHGTPTESSRVTSLEVLSAMKAPLSSQLANGQVMFVPTENLSINLKRLLDVRRVVGLRNPAHSLVKLMNPVDGEALLISSYTHPEYASSMSATFQLTTARALLLRGTEGEVVADARRTPKIDAHIRGDYINLVEAQTGSLHILPELPTQIDAHTTAEYTQNVLDGKLPIPLPIKLQVQAALKALQM